MSWCFVLLVIGSAITSSVLAGKDLAVQDFIQKIIMSENRILRFSFEKNTAIMAKSCNLSTSFSVLSQ
jgi:hypothetical protein